MNKLPDAPRTVPIRRYVTSPLPERLVTGVYSATDGVTFRGVLYPTDSTFRPGDLLAWDVEARAPIAVAPEHPQTDLVAQAVLSNPCFPRHHESIPRRIRL